MNALALILPYYLQPYVPTNYYALTAYATLLVVSLLFLLLGRRDLLRLITRAPRLGTGVSRVWAVARTSLAEARAARLWIVPIVWFIACLLLNLMLRPSDVSEAMGLYLRVLLLSQEFVVIVAILLIAVVSLPQERERRTIITTTAKPLSRLELILGKMVGFSVVAALMLAAMTILSLGFLYAANARIKKQAADKYAAQVYEARQLVVGAPVPQESLKHLSEDGLLVANNFILAPEGVSVAGDINYDTDPPTRLIKGGSQQTVYFHLPELPAGGSRQPFFTFAFGYTLAPGVTTTPKTANLNVTLTLERDPRATFEKTIKLQILPGNNELSRLYPDMKDVQAGGYEGIAVANMTPPADQSFFNYTGEKGAVGPVIVKVTFPDDGMYFGLIDDLSQSSNVFVNDLDPAQTHGSTVIPNYPPKVTGFEKRDYQQIAGPDKPGSIPEVAYYEFKNLSTQNVPIDADGNFTLSLNLDIDKDRNAQLQTMGDLMVYRPYEAANQRLEKVITVEEKRDVLIQLPARGLITATPSDLTVAVRCLTSRHWIGVKDNSVRIYEPPSPFIFNFLKSELVILCETILVVVIAVAASIRLGWPTAILLSSLVVSLGYCFAFVQQMAGGENNSLLNAATRHALQGSAIYQAGSGVATGSTKGLYFLVNLLPDFSKYDQISWIVNSRNMPNGDLLGNILLTIAYAIPIIAVGYFLIRKQELA